MPKTFFIMKDRADSSKGYTEVSEDYFKGYIDGFTDGKPYYINLGYAVMETTEEHYRSYYKDYRRRRYMEAEAIKFGELSYDALDSDEFSGSDIVIDTSEPFEDVVDRKMLVDRIPAILAMLNEKERLLITQLYLKNMSEQSLGSYYGVHQTTISRRKEIILRKMKIFFENNA